MAESEDDSAHRESPAARPETSARELDRRGCCSGSPESGAASASQPPPRGEETREEGAGSGAGGAFFSGGAGGRCCSVASVSGREERTNSPGEGAAAAAGGRPDASPTAEAPLHSSLERIAPAAAGAAAGIATAPFELWAFPTPTAGEAGGGGSRGMGGGARSLTPPPRSLRDTAEGVGSGPLASGAGEQCLQIGGRGQG